MKKIVVILLFLFTLCTCNHKPSETVVYLNNNDVAVYLYNEAVKDDYGMEHFSRMNAIDSEEFTHTYTCIIINVEANRSFLTEEVVDSFYNLLLKDNKVMIIFYEGENYNFFKNTLFSNEKDYYDDVSQICSYNNFKKEISQKFTESNLKSYLWCLMHLETEIKEYRGSL
ncbi:MAG: hypothetical protein K2N65_05555 [Anaeroplasmataceae bacterium]|nr:hypothetical protein [Anaeroplasmataceae bacterium]